MLILHRKRFQHAAGVSLAAFGGNWANAMAAAPAAGNLITVPAGTWPSPQVVPYSGLTIRGAGVGQAIVTRNAAQPQDNAVPPSNSCLFKVRTNNVTITDLTIRGWPIGSGTSDDLLISGASITGLTVQRVNLENPQGIGIQTEFCTGGLFEDITILNALARVNGAHGVGLWLYKGTSNNTYRRITINGTVSSGMMLDAGTTGSIDATSNDNNVCTDISINNAGGTFGGILFSGCVGNQITNLTITNLPAGNPATAWGFDQSGLGCTSNTLTNVTLANIANGAFIWTDQCGNTYNGVAGAWDVAGDPTPHCNTYINCPNLILH